ncbi:uncharacterized protein B0I36DRAFT_393436 [Microdochium trichocladiopsis]|uniref:HMG box domain-containing protein n=1 Tax=Microdochium trichocladiopsis TaxID=1682393 RepID=A0A9P8XXG9_9PEZI|nr:uncharacterized protein B0I36DRAFT_393436 [Microdochium trichocladiopsis]KAH7021182.1 hypothetical protein B0I36DRAFT_393436 [Microdochium trichocladiopsis]
MLDAPLQHHYRTRRASAIESLKESQKAVEAHDSSSASDSFSDSLSSSPVSTASTASTSRDVHQGVSKRPLSSSRPSQLAKTSPQKQHQQQPGMATMTDGHPRHYPHLHLPQLLPHGQRQPHTLQPSHHHHQHSRHSLLLSHHGGARSEYGDIPGSPAPVIDRPASAAAHLGYGPDFGRSSPHLFEGSSSRPSFPSNDNINPRSITSAPPGTATPRGGAYQDAPQTPASPGRMSTDSTGSGQASLKRGRSREIKDERQEPTAQPLSLAAYGLEPRSRKGETRRTQGHQEMNLYSGADNSTMTTHSDSRGPPSASSSGSADVASSAGHYAPIATATAGSGGSNVAGGNASGRELICLCTRAPKVPRPRNAFILYRQHHQANVAANNPGLANPEISKLIGEQWRDQPDEVKESWKRLAEEEKIRHQQQYPDYRYQPRRGGKSGASHGGGARTVVAGGDDPGRCNKCGATPRTPSTPYTPATGDASTPGTASGSGGPGSGGSGYAYFPPGGRALESEHLRRGSISSIGSGDSHARRYNTQAQYPLANINEDYAAHQQHQASPGEMASPDSKRRRYNNSSTYPMSPPAAGNYTHVDPRYQQYQGWQPTSQPSGGALTYGSAQVPRGESATLSHQDAHTGLYGQPPQYHRSQQAPSRPQQHHPLSMSQTHGGPSQGSHAQQQQHQAPQLGAPFDESLRLPPLQPQIPQSTSTSAGGPLTYDRSITDRQYQQGQQTEPRGLGMSSTEASRHPLQTGATQQQHDQKSWSQAQYQSHSEGHSQSLRHAQDYFQPRQSAELGQPPRREAVSSRDRTRSSFLGKLEALRSIHPPLSTQQSRSSETRGPVIAVEGADIDVIRAVSRVIETALLVSQDCAVKVWSDESLASVYDNLEDRTQASLPKYMSKMLRWHETSEELVNYITHHPPKQAAAGQSAASVAVDPSKMPVAIVSTGYSLTISDRWAAALQQPGLMEPYSDEEHWRWIAALWRGIVGADLTIYVRERQGSSNDAAGSNGGHGGVELLTASAVSASNSPTGASGGPTRAAQSGEDACVMVVTLEKGRGLDEKLERRLGFEIMEWVRGGGFSAAATLRQLSATALAGVS